MFTLFMLQHFVGFACSRRDKRRLALFWDRESKNRTLTLFRFNPDSSPETIDESHAVVDDSFVSTQLVQSSLEQSGYETTVASDGREAWMKAQEQQFDLILTDEQMPVMKGTELCRLLRIHELYRDTPISLFTTNGELADLTELEEELHVGVTVFETFEPVRLLSTIQSAFCAPHNSGPTVVPESCSL